MNDYMQLAQLMAPKMMGNAPMGAGAMAGLDFAQQRNEQRTFLDKAAQMAELKAKMESQKAEQMAADAPVKAMERQKKLLELSFASIGPYSNAWDAAKSPQEKQVILDEISNDPNVPEGFRQKFKGAPTEKVDSLFKMVRNSQFNTPQFAQKTGVEEVKGDKRIEQEKIKGANALDRKILEVMGANNRQEAALKAKKELQDAMIAAKESAASGKPLSTDQLLAKNIAEMYDDPETQANELMKVKALQANMQLGSKAAGAQAVGINVPTPQVPKVAPPSTPKATENKAPNFKVGDQWNGMDTQSKQIIKGTIKGIKRDKDGKVIKLNVDGKEVNV